MNAKRFFTLSVIFCLFFSLCGCYDYNEVNDTALVAGIGVDPGKTGAICLTVEIVTLSSDGSATELSSKTMSQEGDTLDECLDRLLRVSPKTLLFSHCDLAVFSEAAVRRGVSGFLDDLLCSPRFRPDLHVAVVTGGTARDLFSRDAEDADVWAKDYTLMIRGAYERAGIVPETLLHQISSENGHALLPALRFTEEKTCELAGAAALEHGKLKTMFSCEEVQALLLSTGRARQATPVLGAEENRYSCRIRSASVQYTCRSGETVEIETRILCRVELSSVSPRFDLSSRSGVEEAQRRIADDLREMILNHRNAAFASGAGAFWNYGEILRQRLPAEYRRLTGNGGDVSAAVSLPLEVTVVLEYFGAAEAQIIS